MSTNQSYGITTWRLRLRCRHPQWLVLTQEFYDQIETFYYELLMKRENLWKLNSQKILRELEQMTLPGREKRTPEVPLPWENVPPYFRRAAANAGIAMARSSIAKGSMGSPHSSAVYYKGMYRDFTESGITLKVWNGEEWKWLRCRLYGKKFPENVQLLSPSVVFDHGFIMLHVPVRETNFNTGSVKERMRERRNICALQFTNTDAFAVGTVLDGEGKELSLRFFRGGKEYSHYCRIVLEKLDKSRRSLGDVTEGNPNQRHWLHLKNLSEHYAHKVSREIVRFCQENEVFVIALPRYEDEYTRYVMNGSGNWNPLHLSTKIRKYLGYKAWTAGIMVIEVHARESSSVCAVCGGEIAETDKDTGQILCVNGHHGNRYLNAARNLGKKCREQFQEKDMVKNC